MKKLIIILSIFAVVLSSAVFEQVYFYKFYSKTYENLEKVTEYFEKFPDDINNSETVEAVINANDAWESKKRIVMVSQNHLIVKYIDEKFVSLICLAKMNQFYDANVTLAALKNYVKDQIADNRISITNIF